MLIYIYLLCFYWCQQGVFLVCNGPPVIYFTNYNLYHYIWWYANHQTQYTVVYISCFWLENVLASIGWTNKEISVRAGHNMINGFFICNDHSWGSWHYCLLHPFSNSSLCRRYVSPSVCFSSFMRSSMSSIIYLSLVFPFQKMKWLLEGGFLHPISIHKAIIYMM